MMVGQHRWIQSLELVMTLILSLATNEISFKACDQMGYLYNSKSHVNTLLFKIGDNSQIVKKSQIHGKCWEWDLLKFRSTLPDMIIKYRQQGMDVYSMYML
jgi:hypothetical protein